MVPLWHSEIDNGIIWHKLMAIWKITILTYCFGPCFFGPIKLYPHDPVNPTLCVVLITIQLLYVILFQSTRNNVFFLYVFIVHLTYNRTLRTWNTPQCSINSASRFLCLSHHFSRNRSLNWITKFDLIRHLFKHIIIRTYALLVFGSTHFLQICILT